MPTLLTARARLASELRTAGINLLRVDNPYNFSLPAWTYEATPEAVNITIQFYEKIGKPLPPSVKALVEKTEAAK